MKKLFPAYLALTGILLTGCGTASEPPASSATDSDTASSPTVAVGTGSNTEGASAAPADDDFSFVDGTYNSPTMTFKITNTRVIPVGEVGNKNGDAPVLAFHYETTNNGTEEVDPRKWLSVFSAVQDNDPNVINELLIAPNPDPETFGNEMVKIEPGGTAPYAAGYYLTDTTTPVDLIASTNSGSTEIGRQQFPVQ